MRRREFVRGMSVLAAGGLLGVDPAEAAEGPPEITTVRLTKSPAICFAPVYVAEELLRAEGFANVRWAQARVSASEKLESGEADLGATDIGSFIRLVDAGLPVVALTGLHVGCYELFGTERIRTVRDLKGKTVAVTGLRSGRHLFVSVMAAYVGLDPRKDIQWVEKSGRESIQLLAEGKVDAFIGFPPEPQELRARKIGRLIVSTTFDRPWSQYFCCFLLGQREFVRKYPVATRRAMRAILKANAVCSLEPERVARDLVDRGFTTAPYEYAAQAIRELPYGKWREQIPEDSIRFHAVRLHETGMVKSSPQKLIAQGTDWRFLNELKKEMKG
jgi:NitT/TauT family transport system substrate-binding protein